MAVLILLQQDIQLKDCKKFTYKVIKISHYENSVILIAYYIYFVGIQSEDSKWNNSISCLCYSWSLHSALLGYMLQFDRGYFYSVISSSALVWSKSL